MAMLPRPLYIYPPFDWNLPNGFHIVFLLLRSFSFYRPFGEKEEVEEEVEERDLEWVNSVKIAPPPPHTHTHTHQQGG